MCVFREADAVTQTTNSRGGQPDCQAKTTNSLYSLGDTGKVNLMNKIICKKWMSLLVGIALLSSLGPRGMAQTTAATLSGVLTDETGAVLPGAHVVVLNTDTGVQRTASTDEKGLFLVAELPPGSYQVNVSLSGFETLLRKGITLLVGQRADIKLAMKVGSVTQEVTVTGEAPIVNTSTSSVSGVVEQKRIEELPLNGRDFSQLPLVQPGVAAIRNGGPSVTKGYGARISMAGSRADQTAWLLDGTNIGNMSNFGTPGSAAGVMLGVDAVREFQVLTSDYSAELGGTSGGVVSMVSKAGTNELHGSAYEFLRNSDLDARNFFDQEKQAFKRNQFGSSLGGPIKKDKTFFFGNYEGLRQRLGVTNLPVVPDANVHDGLIPTTGGGFQRITIAPEIRPYLNLWPLPNGPSKGGGLAALYAPASSAADEDFFVVRVDHHLTDQQSLFSRFTFDQGNLTSPDPVPVFATTVGVHSRYSTVQHDYIMSPQFLMTTRIAYNRTLISGDEIPLVSYPSNLNLFLPRQLPLLSFPGVTPLGPAGVNLGGRVQNLYNLQENLQYIHHAHSMRFGVQIQHVGSNINAQPSGVNGTFTWSTVQDFLLDNKLSSFAGVAPGGDVSRSFVQYIYGTYFQDDWKMRSNFTWNLGLRYEPFSVPSEKHGRISAIQDWVNATAFQTNIPLFNNPSKKNFSPRVGFAWDPKGDGKTAVRAGFGLFFVNITGSYFGLAGQKNQPFFGSTASVLGNLASAVSDVARIGPSLLSPVITTNTLPELIQWNLNPSYEVKTNIMVERQLPGNLSVSAGYLGGRGIHLWRRTDANDAPPIIVNGRPFVVAGTPRLNPRMGVGAIRYSDAQSFYNALQIELKKRFSHGFQFQSSYTWSKNIDDSTTAAAATDYAPGGNGLSSQSYSPKSDRGLSSLHVGQTLVINGIYAIPTSAHSGFSSVLLGGWQVASIFTANSGAPFSVYVSGRNAPDLSRYTGIQFPDRVAGRSSSNIVTGNPNQYIDLTAFVLPPPPPPGFPAGSGFYGNAGRNILLGPGLFNLDFSLLKTTPVKFWEGSRLEFHADFFNLMNRANFAIPNGPQLQVLNPTTQTYIPGAGQISSTVTTSRQLQFGLKLIF
jgi:carboxypeptidase family protein/TonB-dependent receptor-like protein